MGYRRIDWGAGDRLRPSPSPGGHGMSWINDAMEDPRFWVVHLVTGTGQIGPALDQLEEAGLFSASSDAAWQWMETEHRPVGGEEIGVEIASRHGVSLYLDLTEEPSYYLGRVDGEEDFLLAGLGGHWSLPGLRWRELMAVSEVARARSEEDSLRTLGLLLPVVWICAADERAEARGCLPGLFEGLGCCPDQASSSRLTSAWIDAVDARGRYRWLEDSKGWHTDAKWSPRARARGDREILNRLLQELQGG